MGLTAEQLEVRRRALGASEIGVLMAAHEGKPQLYRNVSPFSIWDYHVFGTTSDLGPAADAGSAMEPGIAQLYLKRVGENGLKLRKGGRRVHSEQRWRSATPDYYVLHKRHGNIRRLLECKWVGPGQEWHWDDTDPEGVPDQFRYQVEWQMDITGIHEIDLCAFFASWRDVRIWRFQYNEERLVVPVKVAHDFWFQHVVPQVPPEVDDSEAARQYLARKHGKPNNEVVQAPAEAEILAEQYNAARQSAADAQRLKDEARNRLCKMIGDNAGVRSHWGTATWKAPKVGKRNDTAIAQEFRNMLELRGVPADELDAVVTRNTAGPVRTFRLNWKGD